ncbi:PDT-domain-containing protein [Lactarius deliciosus]|nr:PDT-domain-containing protein [Lactarius deliciosus]
MPSNPITEQIISRVEEQTGDYTRPVLTYLGPAGTYSHQAAFDRFAKTVHYRTLNTISDVFHSVGPTVHLALLPQENSIFGIVTETYDLLRSSDVGESKWVRGTVTLPIQHCLVVRRGKTLRDIKKVLSHEQALGQCQRFLAANLSEAQQVSVASTAAAAEVVSKQPDATADCAAICSKICLQLFADLELLHEGIQNEHQNFTRFYILANHATTPLPNTRYDGRGEFNALIRLELQQKVEGLNASQDSSHPTVTDLLAALRLPAIRIDRRPSAQHELFGNVYLVEVFDNEASNASWPSQRVGEEDIVTGPLPPWKERILDGIARVVARGGRADLLGTW